MGTGSRIGGFLPGGPEDSPDSDSDSSARNLGLTLSIVGSLASSSGVLLQKLVKKKVEDDASQGPEFVHFKYIVGLLMVVAGLVCKTVICFILPQLTLAALAAQSFVYTSILDQIFLYSEVEYLSLGACVVVCVGGILAVLASDIVDADYSLEIMHSLFVSTEAIAFTVTGVFFIIVPRFVLTSLHDLRGAELSWYDLVYRVVSSAFLAMWYAVVLKAVVEASAHAISSGLSCFFSFFFSFFFSLSL